MAQRSWQEVAAMAEHVEESVDAMYAGADEYITHLEQRWARLRKKVNRERKRYEDKTGLNKPSKEIAAALEAAYGSVVRMMDLEEAATKREL